MKVFEKRLSDKTAVRLWYVLSLGLLMAGPAVATWPAQAQTSSRSDLAIESDVLKALGNYPDISSEHITANTSNGVVTLNGTASSDTARSQAQVVAATVDGVRSVLNHVTVDASAAAQPQLQQRPEQEPVQQAQSTPPPSSQTEPQSESQTEPRPASPSPSRPDTADGNWGPAGPPPDAQNGQIPSHPQAADPGDQYPIQDPGQDDGPAQQQAQPQVPQPPPRQRPSYPQSQGYPQSQPYPQGQTYPQAQGYPQPQGYPRQPGYPQPQGYPRQQPPYAQTAPYPGGGYSQPNGGYAAPRLAATPLTIPEGTLLTVRTSEPLDSRRLHGGEPFQAVVARDIYEGEYLAVPRGTVLEGRVIGVKKPGAFAGGAGFALQIVAINLGGQSYPVATDTFASDTTGKGGYTTANTIGGAAIGAIIGGIAGRGPGAAIGAAAGGVAGAGVSAATPGPREVMPPETMLSFHLQAPVAVNPISAAEVQRLQASVQLRQPRPRPYPYAYGYPPPPYYYRPYYPYRYYYWR